MPGAADRPTDPAEDPEVVTDEEWSDEPAADDDPQGMRGQLDDSMNGLDADDDVDEAARGIPQGSDGTTA